MARARRQPRSRRARYRDEHAWRDRLGVLGLGLLGVLLLGGFTTAIMLRSGRGAVDPESFCPVDGPLAIVAVLIDTTDPLSAVQAEAVKRRLASIKDEVPTGAAFELYRVEAVDKAPLVPSVRLCNPGRPEEASRWTSNPRKVRQKFERHFDLPIENAIAAAGTAPPGNTSPLLESLQSVAVTAFSGPGRGDRPHRLVIVSDMLQHSAAFSVYRGDDLAALPGQERFLAVRPDLAGTEVSILMLNRAGGKVKQGRDFILGWSNLIAAAGGEMLTVDRL